jgi:hypothetical protein
VTVREVISKNIVAIQELKYSAEQMNRAQESQDIERRYNEEHPKEIGIINPEYIGKATGKIIFNLYNDILKKLMLDRYLGLMKILRLV